MYFNKFRGKYIEVQSFFNDLVTNLIYFLILVFSNKL